MLLNLKQLFSVFLSRVRTFFGDCDYIKNKKKNAKSLEAHYQVFRLIFHSSIRLETFLPCTNTNII